MNNVFIPIQSKILVYENLDCPPEEQKSSCRFTTGTTAAPPLPLPL